MRPTTMPELRSNTVSGQRPPRKSRSNTSPRRQATAQRDDSQPDTRGYSAPGHMGGQFDDAGYSSGIGQFGFHHHTTPPLER